MSAIELAKILAEEFERDGWGLIDPDGFRAIADCDPLTHDGHALVSVLARIAKRIREEKTS